MSKKKQPLPIKHVPKGWGWERWIVNCPEYCGKLLFFNKGKRCSWHFHKIKDEVFYLQSGKMMIYYSMNDDIKEANQIVLNSGEKFHVPIGLRHQMVALEDSELFEFSTEHFDSDSHRIIKGD
jgi:quercetin dioxygenase-like cupin family protein